MAQVNSLNLVVVCLVLGMSSPAVALPPSTSSDSPLQQYAQAEQTPSQIYQDRLQAAKTPQGRAEIQAEYDRMQQQAEVSDTGVIVAPGTASSGVLPDDPGDDTSQAGESPVGGGSVPRGQSGD